MKYNPLIFSFLILIILCTSATADNNYIINSDTVYIDDSKVYLSATPHTLSCSGWVYFNLTSKIYTGNIDACWGFNTSISKPIKAKFYSPHWINTTTNHQKNFYNSTHIVYTDDDLNYGNSYNTNYKYTIMESIVNENGTTYITSNAAFDSYTTNGTNYTIYWYTRHDNYYLWKDFTASFNSIIYDYEGYDKWYYIKNVPITSNKEYTLKAWIDVPVSTEKQSGKYFFAIKPSGETIFQAINNGHFYNLDPWWNATWSNRKNITLTGNVSGAQTDYQLLLNISYENNMQIDFDDLRFANETHELDSWVEYMYTPPEPPISDYYALVWVEFPTTPANGVNQTYYMYYGNDGAASNWNGTATFAQYYAGGSIGSSTSLYPNNSLSFAVNNYAMRTKSKTSNINGDRAQLCMIASHSSVPYTVPYSSITVVSGTFETLPDYDTYVTSPDTNYHIFDIYGSTSQLNGRIDDDEIEIQVACIPTTFYMGYRVDGGATPDVTMTIEWGFIHKYTSKPPTYAFGSEEYYIPPTPTTIANETKLIMSEITIGLKSINVGDYLVYAFILIGILLIILLIQIIINSINRG